MVIVSISFGIYKFSKGYDLDLIYENIDWSIVNKSVMEQYHLILIEKITYT